jgi:hypothetical protein
LVFFSVAPDECRLGLTGGSASSAMADVRVSGSASVVLSADVTTSSNNGVVIRDHRSPRITPAPARSCVIARTWDIGAIKRKVCVRRPRQS